MEGPKIEEIKKDIKTELDRERAETLERVLNQIEQWMPKCRCCELPFGRAGWVVNRHLSGDAFTAFASPFLYETVCPRCGLVLKFLAHKPRRKVEVLRGDEWQETQLEDIKAADVFRMFEDPEKTVPVKGTGNSGQFVAKADPCYQAGELLVDAAEIILKVSE